MQQLKEGEKTDGFICWCTCIHRWQKELNGLESKNVYLPLLTVSPLWNVPANVFEDILTFYSFNSFIKLVDLNVELGLFCPNV